MSELMSKRIHAQFGRKITWRQPVVCAIATVVCTALAIWAVVAAPVGQSPVAGVSGLYIAAAVYVPLALWFGVWGSIAGYLSCVFMGIYSDMPLAFVLVWALADFFEGFIPLLIYRKLKMKPSGLKKPHLTYGLTAILALDLVVAAAATIFTFPEVFVLTFVVGIAVLVVQAAVEDHKTWLTWLFVGVFLASLVSGIFGVGALVAFGSVPMEAFSTVFFGWVFGDIIVLSTVGTVLTIVLSPYIVKTRSYVHNYFS
ncbi:MAG: hypothetical protein NWF05_11535 [Candidatus Bathyarchaeota archaeon]|nr:hypothetical protein [Candidatus Bathyarchaeota archaeon]